VRENLLIGAMLEQSYVSEKAPPPPGVAVAARRMMEDENDEVQYGDRIPYVIIRGGPQARLVDRAVSPEELLQNKYTSYHYFCHGRTANNNIGTCIWTLHITYPVS
jgi:DNA polymerase elongation subunit (family B)